MHVLLVLCLLFQPGLARGKRALQPTHEKTRLQKWEDKFTAPNPHFQDTISLVTLIHKLAREQLQDCTAIVLYDAFTENSRDLLLEQLFRHFPIPFIHGQITESYEVKVRALLNKGKTCVSYILFLKDVMRCKSIIGVQNVHKVVIVARSSQWRVYEFLASEEAQSFLNLLVIAKSEKIVAVGTELPYILYTHKLYVDALGSSLHQVITSWRSGGFTRNNVVLFPRKISDGFAGHRFLVSLAHQPPFIIKRGRDSNNDIEWEGMEIRLVDLLAKMFNFTTEYREAPNWNILGSAEAVTDIVAKSQANLGIGGLYITSKRIELVDVAILHTQDCAAFVSLASTAIPKYRAIMGPFHWSVWLALTAVYLLAILLIAFSDKHTLRPLLKKPQEIENMFWYVFGTFTNAFSFSGRASWSKSAKLATRLLVGFYWVFTIIITACYTGSIIAFVTLPIFPETVDSTQQLVNGRYQIGTLDKGGWQYWFENSTDAVAKKLLSRMEFVADIESGLRNVTKAFFWQYAFLGSRAQLDYLVRTNFSTTKKRNLLHISSECFVPFTVSLIYTKSALYGQIIDDGIIRVVESGLMLKIKKDVEWMMMRSSTGKLLSANSMAKTLDALTVEDRALTLDDTQGMFLLLSFGFAVGGSFLISEWMGGCWNFCQRKFRKDAAPDEQAIEEEEEDGGEHDDEIDKLFDFEEVFGDVNSVRSETAGSNVIEEKTELQAL